MSIVGEQRIVSAKGAGRTGFFSIPGGIASKGAALQQAGVAVKGAARSDGFTFDDARHSFLPVEAASPKP